MTEHSQRTLKQRDNKERDLAMYEETARVSEDMYMRAKQEFKKKLAQYQTWKKETDIPGIKY
jgi:hypothetical protein